MRKRELFWASIECLEEGIPEWSAHYRNLSLAIKVLKAAGRADILRAMNRGYWLPTCPENEALLKIIYKAQKEAEKGRP